MDLDSTQLLTAMNTMYIC